MTAETTIPASPSTTVPHLHSHLHSFDTTTSTGPPLKVKVIEKLQMFEMNPGVWDGLTSASARIFYPNERFSIDPYSYRAPRAESCHDLNVRLEPILIDHEREQEDFLSIGHASVIQCMLAYLIRLPTFAWRSTRGRACLVWCA